MIPGSLMPATIRSEWTGRQSSGGENSVGVHNNARGMRDVASSNRARISISLWQKSQRGGTLLGTTRQRHQSQLSEPPLIPRRTIRFTFASSSRIFASASFWVSDVCCQHQMHFSLTTRVSVFRCPVVTSPCCLGPFMANICWLSL